MSFKEVKELRSLGKLDEALQIAQQDYDNDPANIWNKRSLAWVYYDYLKVFSNFESYLQFKEYLENIKSLELPEDEKMIFDNCAFQIGKILFSIESKEPTNYQKVNELFEIIKYFHFTIPSDSYSFIYKAFHKAHKSWPNFLNFADWWGLENFSTKDYLSEEFKGKKMMSMVEQAYNTYSKSLIEGEISVYNGIILPKSINKEKIHVFLPKLDLLIESHPEYQYPPYFKAKLLLSIGEKDNIMSAFIPFAKKKKSDFWVWDVMADIFLFEDERKIACLSKALSLRTQEAFLINTRQKMAELLIQKGFYVEAKTEIEKLVKSREDSGYKIPDQVQNWIVSSWYVSAKSNKDNSQFYSNYIIIADEILYYDLPEEVVAVEFVNENKQMLNFVKDKTTFGFLNYSSFNGTPKIGDLLKVRILKVGDEGFYKSYTISNADINTESSSIRNFSGKIRINDGNNFGFVDDIYVDLKLCPNINNNSSCSGIAIISYNKKKDSWGWKAIELNDQ